jgi:RNA-directed DNA polymerase
MRAERRDPTFQLKALANQPWEEPVSEAKPYDIPKQLVWKAYQRVRANRGAAGVDGVSLTAFEKDLKGNLYKIWNRMSSGSYFPPPVRLVEIPKDNGGTRPLGIPTIADRRGSRADRRWTSAADQGQGPAAPSRRRSVAHR